METVTYRKASSKTVVIQTGCNCFNYEKKRITKKIPYNNVIAWYNLFHYKQVKGSFRFEKLPQAGLLFEFADGSFAIRHEYPICAVYKFSKNDVNFSKHL
jgi:hypothetical protein